MTCENCNDTGVVHVPGRMMSFTGPCPLCELGRKAEAVRRLRDGRRPWGPK